MEGGDILSSGLGNATAFSHPNMRTAADAAVEIVIEAVRGFRSELCRQNQISPNERAMTEVLVLHLNRRRETGSQPFIFHPESMEDRSCGNSAAADIGVFWQIPGRSSTQWPRVTAVEAKRLDASFTVDRRREYVVGHEVRGRHVACGGMERYKKGIHGSDLKGKAMLLGYVQSNDFPTWARRVNSWIADLAKETCHVPPWTVSERLGDLVVGDHVAKCESSLNRASDTLAIIHVWVDLVSGCQEDGDA